MVLLMEVRATGDTERIAPFFTKSPASLQTDSGPARKRCRVATAGLADQTTLHLALAPLPIKGIDSSADFSLNSFLFQILALIAVGLSTPDTEFQLHSMIFPIETEGD
jgi:hypothetical protein